MIWSSRKVRTPLSVLCTQNSIQNLLAGTHAKNKQKDAEDDSSEGAEVLNRVFEGTSNAEDAQRNQEESEDIIEKVDDDTQTPIPNQRHPFTEYIQQARNKSDATTTTKGKHKNSGSPNDAIDLDDDSDE